MLPYNFRPFKGIFNMEQASPEIRFDNKLSFHFHIAAFGGGMRAQVSPKPGSGIGNGRNSLCGPLEHHRKGKGGLG